MELKWNRALVAFAVSIYPENISTDFKKTISISSAIFNGAYNNENPLQRWVCLFVMQAGFK